MLRFVIGVDTRAGALGAELERRMRCTYDSGEFQVTGVNCSQPRTSFDALYSQADEILNMLRDEPARIYLAVCVGRMLAQTPCAAIRIPITVLLGIAPAGEVLIDHHEAIGYFLPMKMRGYTQLPRPKDLLDVVHDTIATLVGVQPELLPHEVTLP